MIPAIKKIKPQLKNDTFNGVRFTLSPATDLTGASIRTQFRKGGKKNQVEADLSIGSGITVEDLVNGVFVWDEITPLDWDVATYNYDVQITFASGDVRTYIEGTMAVTQDTTY
jgi:hypothetical protein